MPLTTNCCSICTMPEAANHHQKKYFDEVMQATDVDQCISALDKIADENLLADVVGSVEDPAIKTEAAKRMSNERLLCKITEKNCGKPAGIVAVDKIHDVSLLGRIAENASNKKVRLYASEKLESIQCESNTPDVSDLRDQKLAHICETARKLAESWNWEYVVKTLAEMRQSWKKLDPDGEHELYKTFDEACDHFFIRYENFQIRQSEEQKKKADRDKKARELASLCEEVESLTKDPSANNAQRVDELRLRWQKAYVVSGTVFEDLEYRFNSACQTFMETRRIFAEEQKKRTELLNELKHYCDEAESWSQHDDLRIAEKELAALSLKWNDVISAVNDVEDLESRFGAASRAFESRKNEEERQKAERYQVALAELARICENVEALIDAEDRIDSERQVKETQAIWKNVVQRSPLKRQDKINFTRRFRKAVDQFYVRQNEFKDQQKWEQWANLTVREEICLKLEELAEERDLFKVASALKKAKQKWNNSGAIPREKSDAVWNRYKTICDQLYTRCKAFFGELEQEQANNLALKEEICAKIEALLSDSDGQSSVEVVRSLQTKWREIGSVHRDKDKYINERFRDVCDQYFAARREYQRQLQGQYEENVEKKEKLCEKVEALLDSNDLYAKIDQIKRLNEQWKTIGPVAVKSERELWSRYRTACDKFFMKLDEARPTNLKKKQKLIAEVEELMSEIKGQDTIELPKLNELTQRIVAIQKQWKSIGRVPEENEQETWECFSKPCNEFFAQRRELLAEFDKDYDQNIAKKERLLEELESLTDSTDLKAVSPKVKRIINDWQTIVTVPRAKDRKLERRFRSVCDQFFERKRLHFGKLNEERSLIARRKEELCVRMELLAGFQSPEQTANPDSSLSLSEQLKLAFESNFIVGPSQSNENSAGRNNSSFEEARKIQKAWKALVPSRGIHDKALAERFRNACDEFYGRPSKTKRPSASTHTKSE